MKTVLNKFRVIAVSSNTNSFGLYQFIVVAKTGEAYKLHTSYLNKPTKGQDITIKQTIHDNGKLTFNEVIGIGIEMPEALPKAPKEVVDEVFA